MVDESLPANPSLRYRPNTVSTRGGLNLNIITLDMRHARSYKLSSQYRYLEIRTTNIILRPQSSSEKLSKYT